MVIAFRENTVAFETNYGKIDFASYGRNTLENTMKSFRR
jgi:hypothetical protein